MRLVYSIFLIITIHSCTRREPIVSTIKTNGITLVDTSSIPTEYLQFHEDPELPIYYIGPFKDTIHIGRRYFRGRTKIAIWPNRFVTSRSYSSRNLKVYVDTSRITNSPVEYLNANGTINYDSTRNYFSFFVTFKNISDSILWMGRTLSLCFLHLEAKDKRGHWIKVSKSISELGFFGSFQPHIYIKPGEIILAKIPLYKGKYVADCRLAFGYADNNIVYSNEFKESFNERM